MFWPWGKCFSYISTYFLNHSIIFLSFLHNVSNIIWTSTTFFNFKYPLNACPHIPLTLCDPLFTLRPKTHDIICNTFVTIAQDVGFHTGWKQLHMFPSTTFNSSFRQVDIVFTKDGIHILVNIVIVDLMQMDLLLWCCVTQGFVAFDIVWTKEKDYCDGHPTNQFLLFTIEIFRCLHKQVDIFLYNYANAIWSFKRLKSHSLFVLITFFDEIFELHCKGCKHPPY
jgi:hypothetical protein